MNPSEISQRPTSRINKEVADSAFAEMIQGLGSSLDTCTPGPLVTAQSRLTTIAMNAAKSTRPVSAAGSHTPDDALQWRGT